MSNKESKSTLSLLLLLERVEEEDDDDESYNCVGSILGALAYGPTTNANLPPLARLIICWESRQARQRHDGLIIINSRQQK